MFNINELKVVKGIDRDQKSYSFVGIKRNKRNVLELWLPIGFEKFPENNKNEIRRFFFNTYKTLRKFTNENLNNSSQLDKSISDRDGLIKSLDGLSINYKSDGKIVCYGKIAMIESIIDTYDEMRIATALKKRFNSQDIEYEKIYKYLDKAIYLSEDEHDYDCRLAYVDQMHVNKRVVDKVSTDLIGLYCYIYTEIKNELLELTNVSSEVIYAAAQFKEQYLDDSSTLFGENFENTLILLKDNLEKIYRYTTYKDNDFWIFFDAVERFLYGEYFDDESGEYWGINNFWAIWESMCHEYFFSTSPSNIIYADCKKYANKKDNGHSIYLNDNFLSKNIFFLSYQDNRRYLKPDIITLINNDPSDINIKKHISITVDRIHSNRKGKNIDQEIKITIRRRDKSQKSEEIKETLIRQLNKYVDSHKKKSPTSSYVVFDHYREADFEKEKKIIEKTLEEKSKEISIIDYKYQSYNDFFDLILKDKIKKDITKNLVYEIILRQEFGDQDVKYQHLFMLPYFTNQDDIFVNDYYEEISCFYHDYGIKLNLINFNKLQQHYVYC